MDVFHNCIIGEIVSVSGCFETVNGCFASDYLGLRILCQGYELTGKVSRKDFKEASLEAGDFVVIHGDDLAFQVDEKFREEDNIKEEIPAEIELCNPLLHNRIRFYNNHAVLKKLPPDYDPFRDKDLNL